MFRVGFFAGWKSESLRIEGVGGFTSELCYVSDHYPLNPQNQGGTSENVSYIFGRAPGTPKNVSWNPPRCPEWSVFEGGGGAPKNVSWNLEGHKLHFCHPPPPFQKCVHQGSKLPEGGGGGRIFRMERPPGFTSKTSQNVSYIL